MHLILTLAQGAEPEAVENPRSGMLLGGPRAALGLAGAFAKRTFAKRTPRWDLQERAYLMLLQSRARVAGKDMNTGSLHLTKRRRRLDLRAARLVDAQRAGRDVVFPGWPKRGADAELPGWTDSGARGR